LVFLSKLKEKTQDAGDYKKVMQKLDLLLERNQYLKWKLSIVEGYLKGMLSEEAS
jgi:hypothetical protein